MVKNSPCNAGHAILIPGQGAKIPPAVGKFIPLATTRELWTILAKNKHQFIQHVKQDIVIYQKVTLQVIQF